MVGLDKVLAKQAMAAHELVADLLLALIALHAAAALFHHFVRHDDVLRTMLPGRRRRAHAPHAAAGYAIPLARQDEAF